MDDENDSSKGTTINNSATIKYVVFSNNLSNGFHDVLSWFNCTFCKLLLVTLVLALISQIEENLVANRTIVNNVLH